MMPNHDHNTQLSALKWAFLGAAMIVVILVAACFYLVVS
jgi:hypothetical protein